MAGGMGGGPRAGLDWCGKPRPPPTGFDPGTSSLYRVTIPTELSRPTKQHSCSTVTSLGRADSSGTYFCVVAGVGSDVSKGNSVFNFKVKCTVFISVPCNSP